MKNIFLMLMGCVFLLSSTTVLAGPLTVNKRREAQKEAKLDAAAEEIEIIKSRPTRTFRMLMPVKGDDMMSKSLAGAYHQMRLQALKVKADAITEVECRKVAEYLALSCTGFAVKWQD
jgi:hypothetical protein